MFQSPKLGKEYLFLIIGILPALTSIIGNPDLYESAEMDIAVLEWKSHTDSLGFDPQTMTLIYNIGNIPLTDVIVSYDTKTKDELLSFDSKDGDLQKVSYFNDNLVLYIERISPQSHVKIITNGEMISNETRSISITSNEVKIKQVELPKSIHGGITTINFQIGSALIYYSMFATLASLFLFRFFLIKKSETIRKKFPNYNIKPKNIWTWNFKIAILILVIGHFVLAGYYNTSQPLSFSEYKIDEPFEINDKLTEVFLNYPYEIDEKLLNNIVISIYGIFILGLIFTLHPIRKPITNWHIKKPSEILIKHISKWYLKSQIIPIQCRKKDVKRSTDIIILIDKKRAVMGLISKIELRFLNMEKNSTFENTLILKNFKKPRWWCFFTLLKLLDQKISKQWVRLGMLPPDELNFPPWDSVKRCRYNFVILSPDITLEQAKKIMGSKNMKYAVISKKNCVLGVLNYSLLS